ncbi:V-type ATP synthase subunit E [Sulfuracidifex tepidarius]|uniref:V-type proton ATPase subunit E n=1 Tax=Sulfuracidifex tepidarius TaxID=1294262 RepID=A0A510DUW7_9CREN|nr:V-type ATP synthase subunit E family protein [Sulfuracidifex tepidarius]BBG23985.1 V-type proton ATPase subunit E [Sulfuracidifex tepidarius]BBG26740.1 V-type proton ATPase subunit E [Sulfuracidifex tepidarius]
MEIEELFNRVVKEELEGDTLNEIEKAFEEAKKIVEDNYRKIEAEYLGKVDSYVKKSIEEIEGERAKLEVENKRAILSEKEFWINRVYEEAMKRIEKVVGSQQYKESLSNILKREATQKSIVYCSKRDVQTVKSALKGLKLNAEVSEADMIGGLKIMNKETGEVKDYSLKLFLDQVFDNMRGKLSDILFGDL